MAHLLFTRSRSTSAKRRGLSLRKKLFFSSLICLLMLGVLEFASRYFLTLGGSYAAGLREIRADQRALADDGRGRQSARENLHPYVGWTLNPLTDPGMQGREVTIPVNRLGLVDTHDSIQKRSPDRVIVGMTGGSFAMELNNFGAQKLAEQLQQRLGDGREVHIVRLALAGYKQPQQLMLMSYLYSLGAEFDVLVNLDGFNESILPLTDNHDAGIHYSYPYRWDARMQDVVDPRQTSRSFEILQLRAQRQQLAQSVLASPLRRLALRNLVWKTQDARLVGKLTEAGLQASRFEIESGEGFSSTGPANPDSRDQLTTDVIELWRTSSLQLSRLCAANGTLYVHCLQPNQYLDGSKPLSSEELETAYAAEHPYREYVSSMYPRLRQQKTWFERHGVHWHDMTQAFADRPETLYRDWCCHVNQSGIDILVDELTELLLHELQTREPPDSSLFMPDEISSELR